MESGLKTSIKNAIRENGDDGKWRVEDAGRVPSPLPEGYPSQHVAPGMQEVRVTPENTGGANLWAVADGLRAMRHVAETWVDDGSRQVIVWLDEGDA